MYPFDLQESSLNLHQLVKTDNGEEIPYGVWKFNELVRECYFISDNIHTSYKDLLEITPKEKSLLIKYINDKNKAEKDALEKMKQTKKK